MCYKCYLLLCNESFNIISHAYHMCCTCFMCYLFPMCIILAICAVCDCSLFIVCCAYYVLYLLFILYNNNGCFPHIWRGALTQETKYVRSQSRRLQAGGSSSRHGRDKERTCVRDYLSLIFISITAVCVNVFAMSVGIYVSSSIC